MKVRLKNNKQRSGVHPEKRRKSSGYTVVTDRKHFVRQNSPILLSDVYVDDVLQAANDKVTEILDNARMHNAVVRVLEGDEIVDIYPNGEKRLVERLESIESLIKTYSFSIK